MCSLLGDRFQLLTSDRHPGPDRHRTLEAVIDWSYRLLTPEEAALFCCVSVFRAGFTLEAAQAVSGGDLHLASTLSALVDKSMVVAEETPAGLMRYRLLESLAAFAENRLADAEWSRYRHLHAIYFANLADSVTNERLLGREGGRWVEGFRAEMENMRSAMAHALERNDPISALRISLGFGRISSFLSRGWEAADRIERCLAASAGRLDRELEAVALTRLSAAWFEAGDLERCADTASAAIRLYEGHLAAEAGSIDLSEYPAALNLLAEATLQATGLAEEHRRRYVEAIETVLETARVVGNRFLEAMALMKLAVHEEAGADGAAARARFSEALEAARQLDSPERIGTVQWALAQFEIERGNVQEARTQWLLAADQFAASNDVPSRLTSRMLAAACDVMIGDSGGLARFVANARELIATLETDAPVHHPLLVIRAVIDSVVGGFDRVAVAAGASARLTKIGRDLRHDLRPQFRQCVQSGESSDERGRVQTRIGPRDDLHDL